MALTKYKNDYLDRLIGLEEAFSYEIDTIMWGPLRTTKKPTEKKERTMQLYHCAVLLHPTTEEREKGSSTRVLVPHEVVLAPNADTAKTMVGRKIPEDELGKVDRIEVCVSPF